MFHDKSVIKNALYNHINMKYLEQANGQKHEIFSYKGPREGLTVKRVQDFFRWNEDVLNLGTGDNCMTVETN